MQANPCNYWGKEIAVGGYAGTFEPKLYHFCKLSFWELFCLELNYFFTWMNLLCWRPVFFWALELSNVFGNFVKSMFDVCFMLVSCLFHACFMFVSCLFHVCFMFVSFLSYVCFSFVLHLFYTFSALFYVCFTLFKVCFTFVVRFFLFFFVIEILIPEWLCSPED